MLALFFGKCQVFNSLKIHVKNIKWKHLCCLQDGKLTVKSEIKDDLSVQRSYESEY